jgi:2-(1,2-epoxy-1,2-dihydrophenyl)acetyl-CoA isomerase
MSDSSCVRRSTSGDVAVVTLARPGAMNAIDLTLLDELLASVSEIAGSSAARALVLTGAGGVFCAGADLQLVRRAVADDASATLTPLVDALHASVRALRALPIPTVAAIEGPAVGAGMGLALACDLHVLAASAQLVPGYLRIGASPDGGVSWLLSRAVGSTRAASILLQGRPLDAERCVALGLADAVVADGEALDAAVALAASVAGAAPRALVAMRGLTERAGANTLSEHLDLERATVIDLWGGDDFREGVSAFLEKRTPRFTGL